MFALHESPPRSKLNNLIVNFFYLNLLYEVDQPLLGKILRWQNFSGEGLGDDGDQLGQVGVVAAQHVMVVGLNQICQEAVHVGRLIHVLCHWQPGEPFTLTMENRRCVRGIYYLPDRKDLIHIHLTVVVLQDLGDCTNGVLCGVDVLRLSAICLIDNLEIEFFNN